MANNRPIKTRPPGGRRRFRKGLRPFSWHDGFTTGAYVSDMGLAYGSLVAPVANQAQHTFRELLGGSVDTTNLDRETVRVERVVGDLQFFGAGSDGLTWVRPPVVRIGLVVESDGDTGPDSPASINLWSSQSLGDSKYMYLEELAPKTALAYDPNGESLFHHWTYATHLDCRIRRSFGKTDRLWLVMTFGNGLEAGGSTSNSFAGTLYYSQMLRVGLVA